MIVTVTIGDLWLNPVDDPSAGMAIPLNTLESDPQMQGVIRQYGGGRFRYIGTPGRAEQLPVTLICDTRAQLDFLTTYQGEPVWVRDPKGRKFAAIYLDLKVGERAGLDSATVTLTLSQITASDAV